MLKNKRFNHFLVLFFILSACSRQEEELFLANYTQQFTQQLANNQEKINDATIIKINSNSLNKRFADVPKDSLLKQLKSYQFAVNECINAAKLQQSTTEISNKMNFVIQHWNDMNAAYKLTSSFEMDSIFNPAVANFRQILSAVEQKTTPFAWNLLEISANRLCALFSDKILQASFKHCLGYCDNYQDELDIYTEKPMKIGEETNLHLLLVTKNSYLPNVQLFVNQELAIEKYKTEYEFIPKENGWQEVEIAARVYELNGDTVLLSKKIQIEVLE